MTKKEHRELVYKKYLGRCAYCSESIKYSEMQIDHVIPQSSFISHVKNKFRVLEFLKHLSEFDVDHFDNLMPACRVCNKWKSAFDLELFRQEVFEQVKRLNDYSSNYRMAKKYNLVQENIKPIKFYFETINHEKTN